MSRPIYFVQKNFAEKAGKYETDKGDKPFRRYASSARLSNSFSRGA